MMKLRRIAVVAGLGFLVVASAAGAATLTGKVYDLGGLQSGQPGIPGVWVSVVDGKGKKLAEDTTTDGEGAYRFEGLPDGVTVKVVHEKHDYVKRPTVVEGVELTEDLAPLEVYMAGLVEDLQYLRDVARAIIERAKAGAPGSETDMAVVSSLPDSTQEQVFAYVEEFGLERPDVESEREDV